MRKTYTPEDILAVINKYYCESIFITDGDGNVVFVNELGAERLGSPRDDLMYKNVRDLIKNGVYSQSTALMAAEQKREVIARITPELSNSTVSHSVPVFDESGEVTMVVTNNMSVEHSKEWENILSSEREQNEKLRRELDYIKNQNEKTLIINNSEMKRIYDTINIIAPTDSNIIILGESGTGKDEMARYIHEHSKRAHKAFISINCSAIPENLLESELFGYEKGAFSGALNQGKIGLFEVASEGTIFLDEIGDMPITLQAKILRAIENKEIRRVGGIKNIPIDVRIICATNMDLHNMVSEKRFREDLYYRLSVFTVTLPPLRDRPEEIIPLAEFFLKKLNNKYGTRKYFSKLALETMINHHWPGNIRELRNVVERIYVVSSNDSLDFTPLPQSDYMVRNSGIDNELSLEFSSLKEAMSYYESRYIAKILDECEGNVNKTAEKLGIHRSALYRKTHKLN